MTLTNLPISNSCISFGKLTHSQQDNLVHVCVSKHFFFKFRWWCLYSKNHIFPLSVPPMISIPNQLVGSSVGQRVTLECNSEAYPRSINYWMKNDQIIAQSEFLIKILLDFVRIFVKCSETEYIQTFMCPFNYEIRYYPIKQFCGNRLCDFCVRFSLYPLVIYFLLIFHKSSSFYNSGVNIVWVVKSKKLFSTH